MSMNASFLPEDYLARKLARRSNIVCITLFAVVLTGVMGAYFVKYRQKIVAERENRAIVLEVEENARKIDQISQLEKRREDMMLKAEITSRLVDPVKKSNVLAELINHMPAELSLTELELETEAIKKTQRSSSAIQDKKARAKKKQQPKIHVPESEVAISMVGLAPTDVQLSEYMMALNNHELFTDVGLAYSEQTKIDGAEMREFKIELKLQRGVTMADLEPTRRSRELTVDPMGDDLQIAPQGITTR